MEIQELLRPRPVPIVLVLPFPIVGKDTNELRSPFSSGASRLLFQMLDDAGMDPRDICILYAINQEVPDNDIKKLCGKKADVGGRDYTLPAIATGNYLQPEHFHHIKTLQAQIEECNPNIVIAMGSVASFAVQHETKVGNNRGTVSFCHWAERKSICTYAPSMVLRSWQMRPIVTMDLRKAKRESNYPEIRRPVREIWIEPSIKDIRDFKKQYLDEADDISVDIETARKQITNIGFAPSATVALNIPFIDKRRSGYSYWFNEKDELLAWSLVRDILQLPARKIFQNGQYDLSYLCMLMGIMPKAVGEDTMIMHHAMQPEMDKGLGFLASVYCDEIAWKNLRKMKSTAKDTKAED